MELLNQVLPCRFELSLRPSKQGASLAGLNMELPHSRGTCAAAPAATTSTHIAGAPMPSFSTSGSAQMLVQSL